MDASAYAFVHGIRSTRATLEEWNRRPWPVLRAWFAGSLAAAATLLIAVWVIATVTGPHGFPQLDRPPIRIGHRFDVTLILGRNSLVLALHAMACVAGFIAGSSLPLQADRHHGIRRAVHQHGGRFAILFVVGATTFSLGTQAYILGRSVATVAPALHLSPAVLLLTLMPHAIPELTALFLPLAAWIIASRRGDWDKLLAATFVTVLIAVPILVTTAIWEVYAAPHVIAVFAPHSIAPVP
jgi:hypothetical protein